MVTALPDVLQHLLQLVELLGWLPLLQVTRCSRTVLQHLLVPARGLVFAQLARCGLIVDPSTDLGLGVLVRLLRVLTVSAVLRCDDRTLQGSWWSGSQMECRAAVRYLRQDPPRPWPHRAPGRPIQAHRLAAIFAGGAFARALELLQMHGSNFRIHRAVHRLESDAVGYNNVRIAVVTLYGTCMGFEVYLRRTEARHYDASDGSDS